MKWMIFSAALLFGMIPVAQGAAVPVPAAAPAIKDGAWADALKVHPRLFGPKSYVQEMAKGKAGEYGEAKSEADASKHGRGKSGQSNPAELIPLGIVATAEGITKAEADPYIKDALDEAAKGPSNTHQTTWLAMEAAARTFDFCYEHITPADRAKIIAYLNAELTTFKTDEGAFHNSTMSKINAYLEVAYATWGDNPRAPEFRNYALKNLYEGKIVPVLKEYGAGGGYTEGGWYTRGCLWNLVQGLELARRFERYDGFGKAPAFFYDRLAYEMLQPYPGIDKKWGCERYAEEGDGAFTYSIAQEYPRLTRNLLADYWRGSELAGFIGATDRRGSNAGTRELDLLWDEKPGAASDVRTFPLAHAALGIGRVYARGDWTEDASWLRFECGDPFTQHCHLEAGNFEIYRREPLATESGEYPDNNWSSSHAVNWYIRTVAHNCILVYMPGEKFTCSRAAGAGAMVNDGGQLENINYAGDLQTWKQHADTNEHGRIAAYDNEPGFMYVAGDATPAYSRAKVSLCVREIVFVRPNTFVIFDKVNSTRADYEKTWLMHCRNEPEMGNGGFVVTDGKGKLTGQVLLPEKAKITSVHGYTYHGQTFDAPKGTQNGLDAKWRVEVNPGSAEAQDVFLTVLQTEDRPVMATLVKKSGMVGAAGGNWEVLFDNNLGGTVTIGGKATAIRGMVKPGKWE